jgi:GH25 family lysozyme M1 (1,4-beta-N-acetylmuramidase)
MTGHGFRSMASTLLHEQGWNHQVIERQLAHAERNAVSAAYNFAEDLPERRKMMQAWADYGWAESWCCCDTAVQEGLTIFSTSVSQTGLKTRLT